MMGEGPDYVKRKSIYNSSMTIGVKRGTVRLEPYDPAWVVAFEKEKSLLESAFGGRVLAIEHIGSTSVPGLTAKPIIDMVLAVDSFADLNYFSKRFQTLGYEYMPERMFSDRKFLPKGPPDNRTHHLNIVLKDDPEQWVKPIVFRNYLRNHDEDRDEYARIKIALAAKYAHDRAAYTSAKNDFILSILRKAASEF